METEGQTTEQQSDFTPITTQADFDRMIGQRLSRETAKYSDYDALKEKAAAYDKAEEARKSVEERQAAELAKLSEENAALKLTSIRVDVAQAKGVPAALLTGTTKEELETAADALLEFRGNTEDAPANHRLIIGSETGEQAGKSSTAIGQIAAQLFNPKE